ncbi:hypothetical protein AYO44_08140 [Planctomycetaceae bacterium SCGC AG-212-F19]|nr:hypothetical protein AYO44_08140 [Planctomycetaceae bacterium SCGC AG-212-F19]
MYDPSIGRFLTEDPIGLKGGDANLYRYLGNSPLNAVDPSGLQATCHCEEQQQERFSFEKFQDKLRPNLIKEFTVEDVLTFP